ncbi:hypothetical protein HCH_02840 [Hahella chejuensis KCTC 2396]|uniref:Uncharacterized protein n=1 Tax=Hahella chejuensis (strain KCTC 2396) TaxID=349521 RepID=Q2SIA6_HAHCH|nr:hypothetical protein [Hahella chejuensis]ABC29618.1 hypothetical protein HCH_02840 [Hahella chejuensis KCTC 2396]
MSQKGTPSIAKKVVILVVLTAISLGALVWFGFAVASTVRQVAALPPSLYVEPALFGMLGIGLSLLSICVMGGLELLEKIKKPLRKKTENRIFKLLQPVMLGGLAMIFVLPVMIHFPLSIYLNEQGYSDCEEASSSGLRYQYIVYAKSEEACRRAAELEAK